jgi:hypothetical protein
MGDPNNLLDKYGCAVSPLRKLTLTHGTNETPCMIAGHPINIFSYCSGWLSYDLS